jgi:tetratricopeptide (TPR) repeat protein
LIAVASDPGGASLFVDGKLMGTTPVKARSTPGPHEIKLGLDGYVTRTGKINLPDSRDFELRMAISMRPVRGVEAKVEAPSNKELAKAQVVSAHACSKTGDFACAIAGYQKAYEYDPNPLLLFNIAQMRRKTGAWQEAERAYQSFLKEAPAGQPKIKDEAQKQLAYCQLMQKPAPVATAAGTAVAAAAPQPPKEEEDTDPPVLTHDKVTKATRGQPIRLTARIVDERSGVATPQACWRNLYKRDFECQPMGKIGEDQYGIEVPAKAVNDGFAYYLEAYDNNDNGPARSGAPELPNSVAVEDAPPPKPPAAVLAVAVEEQQQQQAALQAQQQQVPQAALPTPVQPQQQGSKSHLATYICAGGAVASLAAAGGFYFHAKSLNNSLNDPNTVDKQSVRNQVSTEQTVSNVLLGVTLAFAVGAVAFWNF